MKATSENSKLSLIAKLGVFSASLLVASSALYVYSPVIGSYADSSEADVNLNAEIDGKVDAEVKQQTTAEIKAEKLKELKEKMKEMEYD